MTSRISSPAAGSPLTLAVSFGGPGGSLALAAPGWVEAVDWEKKATASELATVQLADLLARRSLPLASITHIIVNQGPGSFTGIRVGLNLARTLAYALDVPIATLDALAVLAAKHAAAGESAFVALKAVQNHYYAAGYVRRAHDLEVTVAPTSLERSQLDQHPATKVLIEGQTTGFDPRVSAADLVEHARDLPERIQFFSWARVNPLYIRGSEAEEKLKKGLLKHP